MSWFLTTFCINLNNWKFNISESCLLVLLFNFMYDQVYRFNVDFAIFVREELLSVNYLLLFESMPFGNALLDLYWNSNTLWFKKATKERIEKFYLCCIRALVFDAIVFCQWVHSWWCYVDMDNNGIVFSVSTLCIFYLFNLNVHYSVIDVIYIQFAMLYLCIMLCSVACLRCEVLFLHVKISVRLTWQAIL